MSLFYHLFDNSSPNNLISQVKHSRLSRGDPFKWNVKSHPDSIVFSRFEKCICFLLRTVDLHLHFQRPRQGFEGDPVQIVYKERGTSNLIMGSYNNLVYFFVKPEYIKRFSISNPETFPLPDGIVPYPVVFPENITLQVNDIPWRISNIQKIFIIPAIEILAFFFLRQRDVDAGRNLPNFLLC
jgi:hypothetical protein